MGYYASATGNLSLRESVEDDEKLAEKAKALVDEISRGTDINFDKYNGEYDVSGHDKYHEEDWNALAEYFDGEISFIGEDDTRWKFILKDGKASEVTPIEFWPESSEESYTDTLLKALREKNEFLNPLNVLEKIFPDFIAAKIWRKEDIKTAAEDLMELPTDITSAINLDEAVENLKNGCIDALTEATDEEWDAVKTAVKDTLRKKDAYATNIVWSFDNDDNGSDLPEEVYIPEDVVLSEGNADAVGDYITDMTGFCHDGYVIELRDKKPGAKNRHEEGGCLMTKWIKTDDFQYVKPLGNRQFCCIDASECDEKHLMDQPKIVDLNGYMDKDGYSEELKDIIKMYNKSVEEFQESYPEKDWDQILAEMVYETTGELAHDIPALEEEEADRLLEMFMRTYDDEGDLDICRVYKIMIGSALPGINAPITLSDFQRFFGDSLRNEVWGEGEDRKLVIVDEVSEDEELTTNLRSGKWTLDADMDIFEDGEKICSAYSYENDGGIWAIIPLEKALKEGVRPDDAVPETMISSTEEFYLNDEFKNYYFKNYYGLDDKDIDLFRRSSLSEWDKVAEKLGLYRMTDKFLPICKVLRDEIRLTFTYDATEAEETMLDDEKKSKVRHRIYSLYQLDWMQRHNWSLQDLLDSMQDYITEEAIDGTLDQDLNHVVNTAFDNVLYDAGFKGSSEIFDTFWEFTETKAPDGRIVGGTYFSDPEYIKELCQIPGDGGELWELYCLDTEYEDILNISDGKEMA